MIFVKYRNKSPAGQGSVLQACKIVGGPEHVSPPYIEGWEILLDRIWLPPSQVLVHSPHDIQLVHVQFTKWKNQEHVKLLRPQGVLNLWHL